MEQSTKAYEPGTVAVATVRGVKGVRVMRVQSNFAPSVGWASAQGEAHRMHEPRDVTDIRPLVVLDLERYVTPELLATWLRQNAVCGSYSVADQIEAQTKPPRIPEPGLWGVVEAHILSAGGAPQATYRWVHTEGGWSPLASMQAPRNWPDLIDPTLIREGLS